MNTSLCFLVLYAILSVVRGAEKNHDNAQNCQSSDELPDYLVIGAGGSGLQMALFLDKYNYSYVVLEKESIAGSFWTKFPRFQELISVNKLMRNGTQKLRFDWHSMLEAPLEMQNITYEYFPSGQDWQRYMRRVAEEADLNIEYGVQVESIASNGSPCVIVRNAGTTAERCARRRVFVGTGLREKSEPLLEAFGGIPYSRMTKKAALRRRVCILGNGNAGFEVAQNVYGVADRVTIYGNQAARLSAVTRYTGDVRIKFLQVLENFHGKLLDTVQQFHRLPATQGLSKELNASQILITKRALRDIAFLREYDCETMVIATGFRSYVPGMFLTERFPATQAWYTSKGNPTVHFIGWLMHERDFRKGASGFLSGYRYLIRNLVHHVREIDDGVPYPFKLLTKEQVVQEVIARIQIAHDLVILQDGVVLRDMIIPAGTNGDEEIFNYYEGITFEFPHKDIVNRNDAIFVYFAWGNGRTPLHVFDSHARFDEEKIGLINHFLHPVIEVNGLERHIMEHLRMEWGETPYVRAIDKTIRAAIDGNLTLFEPRKEYPYARSVINRTANDRGYEPADLGGTFNVELVKALLLAVRSDYAPEDMERLRLLCKEGWFKELYESIELVEEQ